MYITAFRSCPRWPMSRAVRRRTPSGSLSRRRCAYNTICGDSPAAAVAVVGDKREGAYMRNLLGWLETRQAQNTLDYLEIV